MTYRLPDGPVAIQFSGGRSSGYMLRHILDAHDGQLPPDAHVLFQNTGREMPETLDFVQRCSAEWSVPIVWLEYRDNEQGFEVVNHNSASRAGEPFAAIVRKRNYLPNRVARFCTQELKVTPAKKWMRAQGYRHWTAAIGFRADESHRGAGKSADREVWDCWYPMITAGVTRREVTAFWQRQPFDLELLSVNGKTPDGNCDGCFLKSEANRAFFARRHPDRAQWWANKEAERGATFNPRPGQAWNELINHAQRQPDWVFDQEADVYCTQGFGGCHD